jgi:hypothetical protein
MGVGLDGGLADGVDTGALERAGAGMGFAWW